MKHTNTKKFLNVRTNSDLIGQVAFHPYKAGFKSQPTSSLVPNVPTIYICFCVCVCVCVWGKECGESYATLGYIDLTLIFMFAFSDSTTTNDLCSWSDWSDCSSSCGPGFQTRQKTVLIDIRSLAENTDCQGREEIEKQDCLLHLCHGKVHQIF